MVLGEAGDTGGVTGISAAWELRATTYFVIKTKELERGKKKPELESFCLKFVISRWLLKKRKMHGNYTESKDESWSRREPTYELVMIGEAWG